MELLNWLRRRRRFEAGRWESDEDACHGADGLEAAVNWMQHVLGRDFDGLAVERCVIVAEVGEGREARTVYTTHEVDATPVEVRGLLEEGLRGLDEIAIRARRHADVEMFINEALPQMVALLRESATPPSAEEIAKLVFGLTHKPKTKAEEAEEAARDHADVQNRARHG